MHLSEGFCIIKSIQIFISTVEVQQVGHLKSIRSLCVLLKYKGQGYIIGFNNLCQCYKNQDYFNTLWYVNYIMLHHNIIMSLVN